VNKCIADRIVFLNEARELFNVLQVLIVSISLKLTCAAIYIDLYSKNSLTNVQFIWSIILEKLYYFSRKPPESQY